MQYGRCRRSVQQIDRSIFLSGERCAGCIVMPKDYTLQEKDVRSAWAALRRSLLHSTEEMEMAMREWLWMQGWISASRARMGQVHWYVLKNNDTLLNGSAAFKVLITFCALGNVGYWKCRVLRGSSFACIHINRRSKP